MKHSIMANKLDITNFWDASAGTWEHIDYIPDGFTVFSESKSSTYYCNKEKTRVLRVSDHWGSGIRYCNWYLSGFPCANGYGFQKKYGPEMRAGIIAIADLIDLRGVTPEFCEQWQLKQQLP